MTSADPELAKAIRTLSVVDNDCAYLIASAVNLVGRSVMYRRGKVNFTPQDIYDLFAIIQITMGDPDPVPDFIKQPVPDITGAPTR